MHTYYSDTVHHHTGCLKTKWPVKFMIKILAVTEVFHTNSCISISQTLLHLHTYIVIFACSSSCGLQISKIQSIGTKIVMSAKIIMPPTQCYVLFVNHILFSLKYPGRGGLVFNSKWRKSDSKVLAVTAILTNSYNFKCTGYWIRAFSETPGTP